MSEPVPGLPQGTPASGSLGWSLAMVLRHWQELVDEILVDLPHGARGYHILSAVVHEDLPTQAALAARVAVDRTVMTYLIDELETAGLVERHPAPHDRRIKKVVATQQGREVLALAEAHVAKAEEHVLSGLPREQRDQLRSALGAAATAIHDNNPHIDPCEAVAEVLPPDDIRAAMAGLPHSGTPRT